MADPKVYAGKTPLHSDNFQSKGFLTTRNNESFYCIENFDVIEPFFMSIVSSSDLWMYLSSSGGLTAGRRNYNHALFPYETDDKIHLSADTTGPQTIVRIKNGNDLHIWEPFSNRYQGVYSVRRNLLKNVSGSKVIFEEINNDLGLSFCYSWMSSDELGWVRKAEIKNLTSEPIEFDLADGLRNILPHGITRDTQSLMSTLIDAYKVAEYDPESHLAVFRMSSIPVDRAEPSEALAVNTAWCCGNEPSDLLLHYRQLDQFRMGKKVISQTEICGQKLSFIALCTHLLHPGESSQWYIIADVSKDSTDLAALKNLIEEKSDNLVAFVEETLLRSEEKLLYLVALADGNQETGDPLNDRRHFANVMFNIMRGGIFAKGYTIDRDDFLDHLNTMSKALFVKYQGAVSELHSELTLHELLDFAEKTHDDDLQRHSLEYLPLSFSRRHGDPSRPWNYFDINMKKPDGSPSLDYQGNWRDIFQNWETLSYSFPGFLPGMTARFLNATTADGYNPYRIMRDGFDWEVPEPDNPWAFIGYWGDHQIIYLLRLLQMQEKFFPGSLATGANKSGYVFANVPYRLKGYHQILADPQNTIIFNQHLHNEIMQKCLTLGMDAKLVVSKDGAIQKASFLEKILVILLTKLSNLVPDAGIWLNTQRPEWNDANNALVGNGASMVTLCYLRSFVGFMMQITDQGRHERYTVSKELSEFFTKIYQTLAGNLSTLQKGFDDLDRKEFVTLNGLAAEEYREKIYSGFNGNYSEIDKSLLINFFHLTLKFIDRSIASNKMNNGLYHSYNLISHTRDGIEVNRLYAMLEGQVAVLNSGMLKPDEIVDLLKALFESDLWRNDQRSFMLYPFRQLPAFSKKNIIPTESVLASDLLRTLAENSKTGIIRKDVNGQFHFTHEIKNARVLKEKLVNALKEQNIVTSDTEISNLLTIYEEMFNHSAFTGRSGSFYKYEGLGSIYWHMVSKLLLAVGESIIRFSEDRDFARQIPVLKDYYYRIKEGIGAHKTPEEYGAFPTDPYSHTPSMMGAQQPGMTGQVKEDILSRFNELGLIVENGEIKIVPVLLQSADFDRNGELSFSFCSTSFVYNKASEPGIKIYWKNSPDTPLKIPSHTIPEDISSGIFGRKDEIMHVLVNIVH